MSSARAWLHTPVIAAPARARVACALILVAYGLQPTAARAAELEWSAPAECGDVSSVREQVERLIDRSLAGVEAVSFEVRIASAAAKSWRLTLRTHSGGLVRTRELTGASCKEVKEAAAVSIAMTIQASEPNSQPSAAEVAGTPEPEPAPKTEAETEPESEPPPSAAATVPHFAVVGALALDLGMLPVLAPGPDLELSMRLHSLRVVALGTFFPAQRAQLSDSSSAARGGDFSLWLAALLACGQRALGPFDALGCAGFELGQLSVEAVGVRAGHNPSRLAYGPRAEVGVLWQMLAEIGLLVRVGATLPLARDQFVLDDNPNLRVHRPSQLSLRVTLGVEFAL